MRRTVRDNVAYLNVELSLQPTTLRITGAPTLDAEKVWFIVVMPGTDGQRRECAAGLIIDGTPISTPIAAYAHRAFSEELRFVVTMEVLREMASAERVAGRLCQDEWRLDAPGRASIAEFVARFDEERAWVPAATPPAP